MGAHVPWLQSRFSPQTSLEPLGPRQQKGCGSPTVAPCLAHSPEAACQAALHLGKPLTSWVCFPSLKSKGAGPRALHQPLCFPRQSALQGPHGWQVAPLGWQREGLESFPL